MFRLLFGVAMLRFALIAAACCLSTVCAGSYKWVWKSALTVTAFDGVKLRADAFVPVPNAPNETFPVIIFPNSWGCPQIEYIVRALDLAGHGYVALEYETRGWYTSGGEIDTAGPRDRKDGSTMIDFVVANAAAWQADTSKIAFAGISYGAGISLMMAGYDARVSTAVVLSGWNNITDMLYGNETPNTHEMHSLLDTARAKGHIAPQLVEMADDLNAHRNMSFIDAFANARSPQAFLSEINTRRVPVFMSGNYMDRLFRPQYMMHFYTLLQGPKFMLLNQGVHAEPEGVGIFVHDNYIWSHVYKWLGQWLKGQNTGIMSEPPMQFQLGASMLSSTYVPYAQFPDPNVTTMMWYLSARSSAAFGGMLPQPPTPNASDTVSFAVDVPLTSGHGSDAAQSIGIPYTVHLGDANTTTSIVYQSAALTAQLRVCGIPRVDVAFTVNRDSWQFFTYLYAVPNDGSNVGTLLSRSFYTHYKNGPSNTNGGRFNISGVEMHPICRDIPAGYKLALGIALYEPTFTPACRDAELAMQFHYGSAELALPIVSW